MKKKKLVKIEMINRNWTPSELFREEKLFLIKYHCTVVMIIMLSVMNIELSIIFRFLWEKKIKRHRLGGILLPLALIYVGVAIYHLPGTFTCDDSNPTCAATTTTAMATERPICLWTLRVTTDRCAYVVTSGRHFL